jgi:hypothetical protein
MKAVIYNLPKFNGTTFDTFEYFYRLWELDKSVKLISSQDFFTYDLFKLKYNIDKRCFNNIIVDNFLDYKFKNILIFGVSSYKFLSDYEIDCKKIFAVRNDEIFFKNDTNYYDEYNFFCNYINKIYYKIQKIYDHKKALYLTSMDMNSLIVQKFKANFKDLVIRDSNNFKSYNKVNFKFDFFKDFNFYIYIKSQTEIDRHPRFFSEAAWQNIDGFYVNPTNLIDNSFFRYSDRFDFEKRNIENDNLISEFLEF